MLVAKAFDILLQISDVPGAVKFLAEHPNNEMWEQLAQHALNHPVALGELLAVLEVNFEFQTLKSKSQK